MESAESLEILTGSEAVARIENLVCPDAVVRDPAVAEGLALAGRRAASLEGARAVRASGGFGAPGASCVHHTNEPCGQDGAGAFELVACSAQSAVDLSLAAHLLSGRLGQPGAVSLAGSAAEDLKPVRLPAPAVVAALLESGSAFRDGDVSRERVAELAGEALRAVAGRTGRPLEPIEVLGEQHPELLLVAAGSALARAHEALEALHAAGVAAGLICIHLVRPFPFAALRRAMSGVRKILVLEDSAQGALLSKLRGAFEGEVVVEGLDPAPAGQTLEALGAHLPKRSAKQLRVEAPAEPAGRLVAVPAGPWGEETLRAVAAGLARLGALELGPRALREGDALALAWSGEALPDDGSYLLLAPDPVLLRAEGALARVPKGARVLVLSSADSSHELASRLTPEARTLLRERSIALHWLAPPDPESEQAEDASSAALTDAALAVLGAGLDTESRVRTQDPADLAAARHQEEVDFRPRSTLPRMPEPVEAPERDKPWAERIQRFHRTGKALGGPAPSLGVWPAALECLRVQLGESALHPFVLAPHDGPDQPVVAQGVRTLLSAAIDGLEAAGAKPQHLSENWRRLASIAGRVMSSRSQACDLAELLADAGVRLIEELGVSSQTRAALEHDLEALRGVLPTNAAVHDLRPDTALRLYLEVDAAVRAPRNARFRKEMEALSERVADQLTLDRLGSRAGRDPDALAASFGDAGSARVDMKALASTLPQLRGSAPLEPERRARLEQARDAIERYLERDAGLPRVLLLRPPELELPVSGCESWTHPDPLAAAVGVFEGVAATEAELFRAVRLARLELAGEYRPGRHDEALAELSWEGFTSEELALLPAVVVLTTGRRLRGCDRGSLSELLSSSRPVRVLVQDEVAAADEAQDLSRFHVDLGALVISHREAFAVGSSLARPERLVAGMTRMVLAPRPAVALVQLPALDPPAWRSLRLEAALQGRASPDFSYDPDAGSSWAERFDLEANPQPDRPWPLLSVTHLDGGAERTMDVALTFADAMAAEPAYMRHLWTIPSEAWDDLQLPLDDYLDKLTPGEPERWIPYLWVLAPDGTLQRAVATRALAMACRDRLRAWRVIQELGGHSNVYAERAAARARQEVIQDADARRVELEQSHALELDRVGREAARDSMERLAAVLLDPEGFAGADAPVVPPLAPAPPQPGSEALEAVAPPAEQALVAEEEEDDEALGFDEPYIDTPLCTSCNDCTDLNPRLFSYNADKQAFIADASAGSFAELVKAAELCPADCIHPGKPRSDDPTATPDLIERAARYN